MKHNSKKEKVISYITEEIRSLERAPELNGCHMTPEWAAQLEIMRTCLEAVQLSDFADISKQAEREYYAGFSSNTAHIDMEAWTAEWVPMTDDDGCTWFKCSSCDFDLDSLDKQPLFCPGCGKAMAPESWAELEKRLRGVSNG